MTSSEFPKFQSGQKLGNFSAKQMNRISNAAQQAENLTVQGPFLESTKTSTARNIRLNMAALMNYVRARIGRQAPAQVRVGEGTTRLPSGLWYGDSDDDATPNTNRLYEMTVSNLQMVPGRLVYLPSNYIKGVGGNTKVIYVVQSVGENIPDGPFALFAINPVSMHVEHVKGFSEDELGTVVGAGGDENIAMVGVNLRNTATWEIRYLDPNNGFSQIDNPLTISSGIHGTSTITGLGGDSDITYLGGSGTITTIDTKTREVMGSGTTPLGRAINVTNQATIADCGGDRNNLFIAGSSPRFLYHYKVFNGLFNDNNLVIKWPPPRTLEQGFGGGFN